MANLTNEKAEFAIAIFRHFSPLFAIFRHFSPLAPPSGAMVRITISIRCGQLNANMPQFITIYPLSRDRGYPGKINNSLFNLRYTWKLFGAIYQNKLDSTPHEKYDSDSHLSVINRLYSKSGEIRHNQVVLDWLENNALELLPELPTKVNFLDHI